MSKWIDVEDRLPKHIRHSIEPPVLVFSTICDTQEIAYLVPIEEDEEEDIAGCIWIDSNGDISISNITHWQLLPINPKENKDE